jgi:uncharacterized HAD superfamily protein
MKIGLDCDGCLIDFVRPWLKYFNDQMGTSYAYDDVTAYDFEDCMDINPKKMMQLIDEFCNSPILWRLPPIEGAREALEKLREKGDLQVVTSRILANTTATLDCFDRLFPGLITGVHFTRTAYGCGGFVSKKEVCEELELTHMVEDCRKYIQECSGVLDQGFLMDRPWNQGSLPSNVQRVDSWQEIVDYFNE